MMMLPRHDALEAVVVAEQEGGTHLVQYSTVKYSSTVQYSTVQYQHHPPLLLLAQWLLLPRWRVRGQPASHVHLRTLPRLRCQHYQVIQILLRLANAAKAFQNPPGKFMI